MTQVIENQLVAPKLPTDFDAQTRLWFYTAHRNLADDEIAVLKEQLAEFLPAWTAHNQALKAWGDVFYNRIVVIAADETQAGVSGCGIDKSVHFMENAGEMLGVDFFDRMTVGFEDDGDVRFASLQQVLLKVKTGEMSRQTLILDNLVSTKKEFENDWFKPIGHSWMQRFL